MIVQLCDTDAEPILLRASIRSVCRPGESPRNVRGDAHGVSGAASSVHHEIVPKPVTAQANVACVDGPSPGTLVSVTVGSRRRDLFHKMHVVLMPHAQHHHVHIRISKQLLVIRARLGRLEASDRAFSTGLRD